MAKGKNFSCNNLGQRKPSDFYETPYSITGRFITAEKFDKDKSILEPASGHGAIVKVLKKHKYKNIKFYDLLNGKDFLEETKTFNYIITNPPFSIAYEFINKCKELATDKFALLLPLSYLHGKKRFDNIYSDNKYKLKTVYVFTRYPMLGDALRSDGRYRTGMMVYAWYVWEKKYKGEPVVRWLDNNDDVCSTAEFEENT